MFWMAAARRPPKDPEMAAAEKKMAARTPNSLRLYLRLSETYNSLKTRKRTYQQLR
jgi:hypothetical protein